MADGIGLKEPGVALVPVKTYFYRNLALEERSAFGRAHAFYPATLFLFFELAVDGRRACGFE